MMSGHNKERLKCSEARKLAELESISRADFILKSIKEVATSGGTALTVAASTNDAKTIINDLGYEVSEVTEGWRIKWK